MQPTPTTLSHPVPSAQTYQINRDNQDSHGSIESNLQLLQCVFEQIDQTSIVEQLENHTRLGRKGYSKRSMFRAYVASFVLGFQYTNTLIKELRDNPAIRDLCGFEKLPFRTTFNRFFSRMAEHDDLIEEAISHTIGELKQELPDLGQLVAVDATAIHTYSNPNRTVKSDPEARWGVKHTAKGKDGKIKENFYGYKAHVVSDAVYGLPIAAITTPGNASDTVYLPKIIDKAKGTFDWFHPEAVIADRGYDSKKNNEYLWNQGIHPIIKMRRQGGKKSSKEQNMPEGLIDGIYDTSGVPYCMGGQKMEYVLTDPDKGHRYVCPPGGCHLKQKNSGAMLYCDGETWEDPKQNIRLFGTIRKDSEEWKSLYRRRYSVERSFKSMKQARRMEKHTVRRLRPMIAHVLMSLLTAQLTVLVNLKHRRVAEMMWMVPRVA